MPRGLVRYRQAGDLHFVTFSCYRRLAYRAVPETREMFERSLETIRLRYGFCVTGYVVMPVKASFPTHATQRMSFFLP